MTIARRRLHAVEPATLVGNHAHLLDLAAAAKQSQVELFLVGGTVRDAFLDRVSRDLDLVLCAEAPVAETFLATWAARHGSRVLSFDRRGIRERRIVLPGGELDFVLVGPGRLEKELLRRDFTINAMAIPLLQPRLLDLFGGREDLTWGRLRQVSPASLEEDPLRALRAIRLLAEEIVFVLDPETDRQIRRVAGDLRSCAAERIGMEMDRIAASGRLAAALIRMSEKGLLAPVVPEAAPAMGVTQNEYHHLDVWEHTVAAVELADEIRDLGGELFPPDRDGMEIPGGEDLLVLRYALLFHDLGKPSTRTVGPDGRVHFYGHEKISSRLAEDFCRHLHFSRRRTSRIACLVRDHLRPGALGPHPTRRALRRLIHHAGTDLQLLLLLALADTGATRGPASRGNGVLSLNCRLLLDLKEELGDDLLRPKPLLDGHQVMDLLGIEAGPAVGGYLQALLTMQVEGTILTREDAAIALQKLARKQRR
ncbi:MAG: HD domain-containing protein [Acidobacteriota bacterium]